MDSALLSAPAAFAKACCALNALEISALHEQLNTSILVSCVLSREVVKNTLDACVFCVISCLTNHTPQSSDGAEGSSNTLRALSYIIASACKTDTSGLQLNSALDFHTELDTSTLDAIVEAVSTKASLFNELTHFSN